MFFRKAASMGLGRSSLLRANIPKPGSIFNPSTATQQPLPKVCLNPLSLQSARTIFWSRQKAPSSNDPITTTTSTSNGTPFTSELNPEVIPAQTLGDVVDSASPTAGTTIIKAIEHIGDLESLGLCKWGLIGSVQQLMEYVHVYGSLPWIGTIAVTTLLIRSSLIWLNISAQRTAAKLSNIRPELEAAMENLKMQRQSGDKQAEMMAFTKLNGVYKKNGLSVMSPLKIMSQLPVFFCLFWAVQSMTGLPVPGFETGGIWWFKDLTAPDTTYILPVLSVGFMILMAEIGPEMSATPQGEKMKQLLRMFSPLAVYLLSGLPS
ncbi:Mitochondrial inner membrane protein oxa1l, partial [Nowakowskiella sp. JEL0078]